jgi:hypothetical protein
MTSDDVEILDSKQLAERWHLPESWVRQQSRTRTSDPIPHLRLGRYIRFEYGSAALAEWLARRRQGLKPRQ